MTNQTAAPTDPVHIALCCDENYAAYATTVMISALENTQRPERLNFFLIANKIQDKTKLQMKNEISKRGSSLAMLEATDTTFDGLPVHRFGQAVYQRILLGEYLPKDIKKIIYLDSDLMIRDDICLLWETDLAGLPVAAVEDLSRSASTTIGVPRQEYFNSGVLVMDLEQWRDKGIHWKVADFAAENAHSLQYVDQCSLNAILHASWKRLHPRWNSQANIYKILRKYTEGSGYSVSELEEAVAWPAIIHYTGKKKPWLKHCFHPYKAEFLKTLNEISWATQHPSLKDTQEAVRYYSAIRDHWKNASRKRQAKNLREKVQKPAS
ncbi:glycosyltransferase family 8 protein [Marinobacter litoralis]|uniref:glycosyltransferase family 8 protein n=1 Tax=Marinobacter litoralis TaxID=187981 RepID=UPI0018EB1F53|nr:glycosyltransferase family 8 protein [Marinobacter litoralis]MBJ6138735.1 glycosyltransferase family 8 protein [Marinobacter litoralis]